MNKTEKYLEYTKKLIGNIERDDNGKVVDKTYFDFLTFVRFTLEQISKFN